MTAPRILFASNGHGEDDISCKVLDALAARGVPFEPEAWAMVGEGRAYTARGVPLVGPQQRLPGEGFGTISAAALWRDLRAGYVGSLWAQARFARSLRGRHDLIFGTGDIMPLLAGWFSGTPMLFIPSAKSAYYGGADGHTGIERWLMRRVARDSFPRDPRTAEGLAAHGVPVRYLGNPMMDGLDPVSPESLRGRGATVAMMAGSRRDAVENAVLLLDAAATAAAADADPSRFTFLFAAHEALDFQRVAATAPIAWERGQWDRPLDDRGEAMCLRHRTGAAALFVKGRFADVLHASDMVAGMAGTANEQAIGLGLPLVAVPGQGNQGPAYLRMKMRYYGPAAVLAPRDPDAVAGAIRGVLADPVLRREMAAAGRERMGAPGASAAIAARVAALLEAGDG